MIVGLIGYDSIRKHLAACGYYTAEIREKYYLRIADAYIDIKEQRGQYWLENIMKDRFTVSMFGQKRLSREGGIEIVVKELCTRMARDGCQVTCYNRSGHHVSGAEYDNKIEYDGIRQKFVPTIERKGLAAVSSSFFAALYSAFGKYDVVHMMVPFSAAVLWSFGKKIGNGWKKILWQSGKITFIFSIGIEILQLLLHLGTFQLSDIFYNTVGGMIGGLIYCAVMKARKRL